MQPVRILDVLDSLRHSWTLHFEILSASLMKLCAVILRLQSLMALALSEMDRHAAQSLEEACSGKEFARI